MNQFRDTPYVAHAVDHNALQRAADKQVQFVVSQLRELLDEYAKPIVVKAFRSSISENGKLNIINFADLLQAELDWYLEIIDEIANQATVKDTHLCAIR